MVNKLQKLYPTDYNSLIVQYLWQAHYLILLIILLKEFIKINVKLKMITKNGKCVKLTKYKDCGCFLKL